MTPWINKPVPFNIGQGVAGAAAPAGSISEGIIFGGDGGSGIIDETQVYNGTSVTEGGTMVDNWGKGSGGAVSSNDDAIYLGGQLAVAYTNRIGIYTSGTWATDSATLGVARGDTWGSGSSSSSEGIVYGGDAGGNATTSCDEFTAVGGVVSGGSLNTGRTQMAGRGTLASQWTGEGNDGDGDLISFETYDGSVWTDKGNQGNYARRSIGGCGQNKDDGLLGGGATILRDEAETWDGSTCTVITEMNVGETAPTGGGSQTSALEMGGHDGAVFSTVMQEWNNTSWETLSAELNTGVYVMNGGAVPV